MSKSKKNVSKRPKPLKPSSNVRRSLQAERDDDVIFTMITTIGVCLLIAAIVYGGFRVFSKPKVDPEVELTNEFQDKCYLDREYKFVTVDTVYPYNKIVVLSDATPVKYYNGDFGLSKEYGTNRTRTVEFVRKFYVEVPCDRGM